MGLGAPKDLSDCRRFFLEPANSKQRMYEALRAYFIDELPSAEVALAFNYSPGSFQVFLPSLPPRCRSQLLCIHTPGTTLPAQKVRRSRSHRASAQAKSLGLRNQRRP